MLDIRNDYRHGRERILRKKAEQLLIIFRDFKLSVVFYRKTLLDHTLF